MYTNTAHKMTLFSSNVQIIVVIVVLTLHKITVRLCNYFRNKTCLCIEEEHFKCAHVSWAGPRRNLETPPSVDHASKKNKHTKKKPTQQLAYIRNLSKM